MKVDELASLSLAELRDRLMARIEKGDEGDSLDLQQILRYYIALPVGSYTSDGADGLIQLARNFSFATQPADMLEAASLASRMAIARAIGYYFPGRVIKRVLRWRNSVALASHYCAGAGWSLAHELQTKSSRCLRLGFSTVCVAMGQWNLSIR